MRWRPVASLAAVAALALGVTACGGDDANEAGAPAAATPGIDVVSVWACPTPAGTTVGAVYLTLRADADDELVGVAVDPTVAAGAAVHETMATASDDEMMTMAPVSAVALPAGHDVVFEPGGYHIMLTDLAAPLAEGATFPLELRFRDHAARHRHRGRR